MKFNQILKVLALIIIIFSIPNFLVLASNHEGSHNAKHLVRLTRAEYSKLMDMDVSPNWVLDYGNDIWLEIPGPDFTLLEKSGILYQEISYKLKLRDIEFDPLVDTPDIPDGWGAVTHPENDLYLIQFYAPTRAEWLDSLRSNGIEIVQYIHPFTYVVWSDPGQMQIASNQEFVRWSGAFAPVYRVQPQWQTLANFPYAVNALLYRGGDVDNAISLLQSMDTQFTGRKILNNTWEIASFVLPGHRIREAAGIAGVYSIQLEKTDGGLRGEMSDQINVNNHDDGNLAFPGYLAWLSAAGVNGSGVIIANVDGGVQDNHPDLINRLIPCSGDTCGGGASSNHGTHTAGIMAADGSSGVLDPYGFLRGLGMGPGANLVEQVYSPWYQQPGGMLKLMTDSYNNGASLSGNSWGPSGTPQGYDDDTLQVDIGVRDADPDAPGNQPLSYVLSIMNGQGGYQTQGTPDEAKNIFTIGSTKMQTSGGQQILEINDLSSNTAHGPALDGRNIPHMVAPGCEVDSTLISGHGLLCGTSMASPHVSGAVALFIEYYRNLFAVDPSPAMIKAAFLPVAHDLAGNLDADGVILGHPFDYKQGWGRMDTAAVVSPTVEVIYIDNPLIFDNTGESWVQSISPVDPAKPVKMMLVWTDAPGHGLGGDQPAWNNDLDLVATVGGDTYVGNYFDSDGWSSTGGTPDYMNNTEGIFLGPTPPDSFTVQVVAANINSDGIPNFGDDTDQDFALVCYNCTFGADFTLSAEPDGQSVCTPDPAVYELAVGAVGPYSGTVTLDTLGEPDGTSVDFSINPLVPPATSVLTIGNTGSAIPGSYSISIRGVGPTQTHTATIGLSLFDDLPGGFELVEPADRAANVNIQPMFEWTAADQAETYVLEIANDRDFQDIVIVVSDLISTSYTLQGTLEENHLYFWRVNAQNVCGINNTGANSFSTKAPVGSCSIGTTTKITYATDFEDGDLDWTHGGTVSDTWKMSAGADSYYFAQDVSYVNDQWLVSPQLVLPEEHIYAVLSFWNYQSIQDLPNGCADGALIEVSEDGGNNWTAVDGGNLLTDPYDGVVNGSGNPLQGQLAWCGDPQNWLESMIELDDYLGEQLQLRFRLGTDSSIGHNGWGVDDIQVQTCEPTTILDKESASNGLPGDVIVHRFKMDNLGATETYQLNTSGNEWETILLTENPLTITGGMSATVEVAVHIPELAIETVHGMDSFTLTAIAESMPVLDISGKGITLAETHPGVELTPETQSSIAQPGGEARYLFTLTNSGDYTDTFNLVVNSDWFVELPEGNSSGALGSGESKIVELIVKTPVDAQGGVVGFSTLSATSTLDDAVSVTASVTTYLWHNNYLPVVSK